MMGKYKPSETTLLSDLAHIILALGKQEAGELLQVRPELSFVKNRETNTGRDIVD